MSAFIFPGMMPATEGGMAATSLLNMPPSQLAEQYGASTLVRGQDTALDPSFRTQSTYLPQPLEYQSLKLFKAPAQPAPTAAGVQAKQMRSAGMLLDIAGAVGKAVGAYSSAQTAQYEYNSRALDYQALSDQSMISARMANFDAVGTLESAKSQIGSYTEQAGEAVAGAKTAMAGRGLVLGSGTTAEVEASMNLQKAQTVYNMNANAVRDAEQLRTEGTQYQNAALEYNVASANARRTASAISPFLSGAGSLLNSATGFFLNNYVTMPRV